LITQFSPDALLDFEKVRITRLGRVNCLRLLRQTTRLPCSLALCRAGINIAINSAIIAITTRSSIRAKPLCSFIKRF